jgi:cytoskeleton protein RodZ
MTPNLQSESATESSLAPPKASAATAGQLLREARLKAGIHLAVLSVTLKVPVRQLEALEADELDLGKGPVFYRGLVSSVCRHLQTDAAPILALMPQTSTQLKPLVSSIQPLDSVSSVRLASFPWRRLLASRVVWGCTLLLLLTGAFLWMPGPAQWGWLDDIKTMMAEEAVTQEVTEPLVVSPVPAADPMTAPVAAPADASAAAPSVVPTQTVLAPAAPVGQSASVAPAVVSTPAEPEWVFSASGDSWLEVRHPQKGVIWSGVVKAGESTRIQSPLPVSVVVGRAQVVTATLRGQPFDLKPHTQVTVARFEVKE